MQKLQFFPGTNIL